MRHLEDEDIARLIDGTISKKERETFLKHLSECETCLSVYSETLKFVEEEKKRKVTLPGLEKIETAIHRFWDVMRTLFPGRRWVPVTAVMIIILFLVPFGLNVLHNGRIEDAQTGYLVKSFLKMESIEFSGSNNKIYAAVRAGIYVEKLSLLVHIDDEEELSSEFAKRLNDELTVIFEGEAPPLFMDPANMGKKNVEKTINGIRDSLKKDPLFGLFQFGRFLERTILSTFADEHPQPGEIERYLRFARENNLEQEVLKKLENLGTTVGSEEIRNICIAIEDLFWE